jgi:GDP-4-dehydro-6-deoxy-D-mannose reductase
MINRRTGTVSHTLVTGVTGFAGGYLAEALLARGEAVVGLARQAVWPASTSHLAGRVDLRACDLCDAGALEELLRQVRPGRIYHAAGYAQVGRSFQEAEAAWQGNLTATRRLYEAVANWGGAPRILFVGSGLVYGDSPEPPGEDSPLRPDSPYASSKAAADLVSYQYTRNPGLDIVRARPFNHIGPRQTPQFAIPSFARQLVAIERGLSPPVLETGNLSPERDLTDVRDTVAAYLLLMEHGRTGEAYNVGVGKSYSIRHILERLLALSGLKVEVRQRAELVRATDVAHVRVDSTRLRRETGWEPRFRLDQTLADTLAYWRAQPEASDAGAAGARQRQGAPPRP